MGAGIYFRGDAGGGTAGRAFFGQVSLMDPHVLAVELFVVCLGVILISCASSMRQRMLLGKRINTLAEQIADSSASKL